MPRKYNPYTDVVIHLFNLQGTERAPSSDWAVQSKAAHKLMDVPKDYPEDRVQTYTPDEIKECLTELFKRGIFVESLWMLVKWPEILKSYQKYGCRFMLPDKFMEFHDKRLKNDEVFELPPR